MKTERTERIGGWLALAANLGMLSGLVLVAVELRHNTQVVRAQAATNLLAGQAAAELAFMGDDTAASFAQALEAPTDLNSKEIVQLWAYLNAAILPVQQTYTMVQLGLAEPEELDSAVVAAARWLSWNFGQVWWAEMKSDFPADLSAAVDDALAEVGLDYLTRHFEGMRNSMAALGPKGS